jgi:hypothetical protein
VVSACMLPVIVTEEVAVSMHKMFISKYNTCMCCFYVVLMGVPMELTRLIN